MEKEWNLKYRNKETLIIFQGRSIDIDKYELRSSEDGETLPISKRTLLKRFDSMPENKTARKKFIKRDERGLYAL